MQFKTAHALPTVLFMRFILVFQQNKQNKIMLKKTVYKNNVGILQGNCQFLKVIFIQ